MRHIFKLSTLLLLLTFFSLSCKKENNVMKLEQPENLQSQNVTSDFSLNYITVSSKGYLMFHSVNDIVAYSKLLNSSNRDSALSNLQSKGFLKKSTIAMYSKEGDDPYNLYFDEEGLMQVEDILIKISGNENFLYIIKEQNLDPELYSKLISEIYDESKMDKINVDRLEENFDLFGMVDFTPFGINETENSSGDKRPMFGHTNDDCGLHSSATWIWEECTVHHYAFWILTSTQEHHVTSGSKACIH